MDGRIYATEPSTRGHDAVAINTLVALQMRLRGKGCRVVSGRVRFEGGVAGPFYYPDVRVEGSAEAPLLIGEVSSESTVRYDQEVKLKRYRLMPSVRDILMVSQFEVEVQHHFRQEGQMWDMKTYADLADLIPPAGFNFALPVAELYEGLGY
jgi:Uma2 family endonuclease